MFFNDKKKEGGGFLGHVTADGETRDTYEDEGDEDEVLHTVAEDLVTAIHAKDVIGVTEALKAFLACVESLDEAQDDGAQA